MSGEIKKVSSKKPEQDQESIENQAELDSINKDTNEHLRRNFEDKASSAEKGSNAEKESRAERDALKEADTIEKAQERESKTTEKTPGERKRGKTSKAAQKQAYESIMDDTRSQLSAPSRAFSKVIHNRAVEATSEALGSTVARPNAILTGSVSAFIIVLGVYLLARHYGYPLSGSETLIAFAAGWLLGIVFDFLRTMITGKR